MTCFWMVCVIYPKVRNDQMNPKSETQTSKLDTFKLLSAGLIVLVALSGFYYFSSYLLVIRVIGLLIALGVAVGIIMTTEIGSELLGFLQDSRTELRKVVWPTRSETLQTSLAVIVMVILSGVFLWLLDMLLFWIVRILTG